MPLNYTKTALTQVNKKLIRTKLAEVVFPRFVKVDSQRVVGFDTKKYLTGLYALFCGLIFLLF